MQAPKHHRSKLSRNNYCPSPNDSDIPVDVVVFVKKNGQHHQSQRHQHHHHKLQHHQQQQQHQQQQHQQLQQHHQKQQQHHQQQQEYHQQQQHHQQPQHHQQQHHHQQQQQHHQQQKHYQKQHHRQQQQQQQQQQQHHQQYQKQRHQQQQQQHREHPVYQQRISHEDAQQSQRQQQQNRDREEQQQEQQNIKRQQGQEDQKVFQKPKQQQQQQLRKTSAKGAKVISKYYDKVSDENNKILLRQGNNDVARISLEDEGTDPCRFVQSSLASECLESELKLRDINPRENASVRVRSIIVDDDLSHDSSNNNFIAVPTNWKCYKPTSMYLIEKEKGFSPTDSAVKSSSDEDLLVTEDDVFSVASTPSKYYDSGVDVSDIESPLRKISSNGSTTSIRSGHSDLDSRRSGVNSSSMRDQVPSVIKRTMPTDVEVGINDASLISSYIPNYYPSRATRLGALKVDTSLQTNTLPNMATADSNSGSGSRMQYRTSSIGTCHSSSSSSGVSSMHYDFEPGSTEDGNSSNINPSKKNHSSQRSKSFRDDTKSSKQQSYFIPVKEEASTKKRKSRPVNRNNSSARRKNSHSGNCSGSEICGSSNRSSSKSRGYSSDHTGSKERYTWKDRSVDNIIMNHEKKSGVNPYKETKPPSDFRSVAPGFSDMKSVDRNSSGMHPAKQGFSMRGEYSEGNLLNRNTSDENLVNKGVSEIRPFKQSSSLNRIPSNVVRGNQKSSNVLVENHEAVDGHLSDSYLINRSYTEQHPLKRVSVINKNPSDNQSRNRERSKKTNRETGTARGFSNPHTIHRSSSAKRDSSSVYQKNRPSLDSHPLSHGPTDIHNREPVKHPLHPDFNSDLHHVNRGTVQHMSDSMIDFHPPDRETKKTSRRSLRRSSSVCCDNSRLATKKVQKSKDDLLKKNNGNGMRGTMYDIRNKNRAKSMPSLDMIGNGNYDDQKPARTSEKKALISEKVLYTIRGTPTPHVYLPHSPNPTDSQESTLTDFEDEPLMKSESAQSDSASHLCSKPPTKKREKNQSKGPLRDLNTIMHDITNIKANLYSSLLNLHLLNESNDQIMEA